MRHLSGLGYEIIRTLYQNGPFGNLGGLGLEMIHNDSETKRFGFKRTHPRSWWPDGGRPQGGGGWGGGKPPPEPHLLRGLTRRTEGRRIPLRSAHTRRPAYTFRQNSLRHLTFETPFPRFYRAQKTGGMNGACAPFGGRRARCARARGARAARAQLGGMGPWGPLGLFRSHSEW